jgi:tetratricopeptide (TPR) repeat protein
MEIKLTLKTKILLIFLGLLSSLLFLELGLRLGGYLIIKSQDMNNKAAAKKPGGYRILCIGESTTAGQYTKFLGEALNKKCSTIRFTVIDKGRGATNTSVLLSELPFNIEYYHPDMVVAMMGVNDSGYNMVCEKQSVLTGLRVYKLCRLILLHFRSSYGAIQLVPWRKPVGRSNRSYHVHKTQRDMDAIDQCDKFILSNDIAQTENGLRSLTVTYPDVCRPYIDLAKLYFRQGRPDKADGTINMIKKEYLKDNDDCVQLLMYYAAFGKEKEVVRTAHELIKEKPELAGDHRVYLHLGNAYQSQGRHAEAERAYRKSLEIAGDDADILAGLGEACWLQGKNTEAEQVFRKALQLDPADPRANGIMGAFYLDTGRTDSAEEYFKKVEGCFFLME